MLRQLALYYDVWRTSHGGPWRLDDRQRSRLQALVRHARCESPYYRELYRDVPDPVSHLRELPPVTKAELMARFDDWPTNRAITRMRLDAFVADATRIGQPFLGQYWVWTTSGSTGTPATLVFDERALRVINAVGLRALGPLVSWRVLWGMLAGGGRIASVFVTGGHALSSVMNARAQASRPGAGRNRRTFSVFTPTSELVRDLNSFQPSVISSYPSMLAILAREQQARRLVIAPVLAAASGETLRSPVRALIEDAFGCVVIDQYNASEAPLLTFECRHRRLHVNSDWYLVEPVDRSGTPVPPGRASHTAFITNLANTVQPIIRYDIGDSIVRHADPCPCGSRFPSISVEGRDDATLRFRTAGGAPVEIAGLAIVAIIEGTPGVGRYQVVQTAEDRLEVRLEVEPGQEDRTVWSMVRGSLERFLATHGVNAVVLDRSPSAPRADPRSGKFRLVCREA